MPEVALNVPFDADEVKEIAVAEFRKRLDGLSPLQGGKEYAAFVLDFNVKLKLRRTGEMPQQARETLAWGSVSKGDDGKPFPIDEVVMAEDNSTYESGDPNEERVERDMPLTVETSDGKGGKTRRKVKVRG